MKYKYLPDSYDYESQIMKEMSDNMFLELQVKYRESLEKVLKKYVNFNELDNLVKGLEFSVPTLDDLDYNFYHKFSSLGSKYIFLRNNIHIERLKKAEIFMLNSVIIDNELLPEDFIIATLEKVLFENGNETFFGVPMDSTKALSQSLVFEFAYDDKKCSIEEGKVIRATCNKIMDILKKSLEDKINEKVSFIINEGFDNSLKNYNGSYNK